MGKPSGCTYARRSKLYTVGWGKAFSFTNTDKKFLYNIKELYKSIEILQR
jgi:hypothetical protein